MRNIVILFSILEVLLTIVQGKFDFAFDDKVAYTTDGKLCWTNCKVRAGTQQVCIADESFKYVSCHNTEEAAPVYYTTLGEPCLSRCVPDESTTGRCIVSQDQQWGICDADFPTDWVRDRPFTEYTGPCKDACVKTGENHRCNNYWEYSDRCFPEKRFNYVQARTVNKKCLCRGSCKKHEGKSFTWCASDCGIDPCALPALPRPRNMTEPIQELLNLRYPVCINLKRSESEKIVVPLGTSLLQLASDLDQNPYTDRLGIFEDNTNPIYSVTRHNSGAPLVIRAEIMPKHLRLSVMDDQTKSELSRSVTSKGLKMLVSHSFGGPIQPYNLIQREKCYKGSGSTAWSAWVTQDNNIMQHLNKEGDPRVRMTIVNLFEDGETSPRGTIRQVIYYKGNAIVDEYYQYVPADCSHGDEFNVSSIGPKSLLGNVDGLMYNGVDDDNCHEFLSSYLSIHKVVK